MAFLAKNQHRPTGSQSQPSTLAQMIQVQRPALILPQSTTEIIFRVFGGRVLVHMILGEVTVVISGTNPVLKVSSAKLDGTPAVVGTAVDVASTTDISSLEVGGSVRVIGSGAALVKNNAGAGITTLGSCPWVAPVGEIYLTAGASSVTGTMKWDLWYQPLDPGAFVTAVNVATAKI